MLLNAAWNYTSLNSEIKSEVVDEERIYEWIDLEYKMQNLNWIKNGNKINEYDHAHIAKILEQNSNFTFMNNKSIILIPHYDIN